MWKSIKEELPPQGVAVMTKIDDAEGVRNVQRLVLQGNLFWVPTMDVYVYYTPTHWALF